MYAIKNDWSGWRTISSADDAYDGEFASEEAPSTDDVDLMIESIERKFADKTSALQRTLLTALVRDGEQQQQIVSDVNTQYTIAVETREAELSAIWEA